MITLQGAIFHINYKVRYFQDILKYISVTLAGSAYKINPVLQVIHEGTVLTESRGKTNIIVSIDQGDSIAYD